MKLATFTLCGALFLPLGACATNPRYTVGTLDQNDQKFRSTPCLSARQKAGNYNNRTGERAGAGLALGLLLGPAGLPVAAALDSEQESKRREAIATLNDSCVTIEPKSQPVPPNTSPTVPLKIDSQPAGAIALVTREPLGALVRNISEADRITSLGADNPYWNNKVIIAHCLTPCVVNVPRGAIFYANALKRGYTSTGYGKGLTWIDSEMYGRTLNSDSITFRLIAVAPEPGSR